MTFRSLFWVAFATGNACAQTSAPAPAYTYDVVSIHKSDPAAVNVHISPGPQGGLRTENTTPLVLLTVAYDVQTYQIIGAPGWVSADHFDVMFTPDKADTTPGPGASLKEFQSYLKRNQQRLQAVLRDRFGLVFRAETRELPIYSLIQAKGGNKLPPHDATKRGPSIQTNGRGQITGTGVTMEFLAQQLSMQMGRPVRDETGLTAEYDFKLDWTPDTAPSANSVDTLSNAGTGPSLFTAMTDQLGLRLESAKGPVQVYVVEKIERPSEN